VFLRAGAGGGVRSGARIACKMVLCWLQLADEPALPPSARHRARRSGCCGAGVHLLQTSAGCAGRCSHPVEVLLDLEVALEQHRHRALRAGRRASRRAGASEASQMARSRLSGWPAGSGSGRGALAGAASPQQPARQRRCARPQRRGGRTSSCVATWYRKPCQPVTPRMPTIEPTTTVMNVRLRGGSQRV
jgi:hypothetical protein